MIASRYTADFDFGRSWTLGSIQARAFAGVRTLYANDRFNAFIHTEDNNSTTVMTDSVSRGRSSFFGVGRRRRQFRRLDVRHYLRSDQQVQIVSRYLAS